MELTSQKQITTLCKGGQVKKAYELARLGLEQQQPWAQRAMGWALYYLTKNDVENADYQSLLAHLDELNALDQLTVSGDSMLFENVLYNIAGFVRAHIPPTDNNSPAKLSALFSKLRNYDFASSWRYSFLLQSFIKCEAWQELADFIEWWNLDKLTAEDYTPYRMKNGRTVMSVAEQAFIAKSKALLRQNDRKRIEAFLPQMDQLMETHPEMTYPGYFHGKMLLSLGSTQEEALRVILPFARRKASEFWVWQLLSDVFANEPDKQLACLLRAVNSQTQEHFLGKARIKLATLYIQKNQFDYAKYQIERVAQCYLSQGWHLPSQIGYWTHQPWINTVASNSRSPIDYMAITNAILYTGTEEAIAIVTNMDQKSHKATLVYGHEKRASQKLHLKVGLGAVLKISHVTDTDGHLRILSAEQTRFTTDLDYAKKVEGTVCKRTDKDFAFLKTKDGDSYISPSLVHKHDLHDHEAIKGLIVLDYHRKKESWEWICVSIDKKNTNKKV